MYIWYQVNSTLLAVAESDTTNREDDNQNDDLENINIGVDENCNELVEG